MQIILSSDNEVNHIDMLIDEFFISFRSIKIKSLKLILCIPPPNMIRLGLSLINKSAV